MKKELTKVERSLLLFFETVAVDSSGVIVDLRHISNEDVKIGERWNKEGFLRFKRYSYDSVIINKKVLTYRVKLTDEAIDLAHRLRKERIRRNEKEV